MCPHEFYTEDSIGFYRKIIGHNIQPAIGILFLIESRFIMFNSESVSKRKCDMFLTKSLLANAKIVDFKSCGVVVGRMMARVLTLGLEELGGSSLRPYDDSLSSLKDSYYCYYTVSDLIVSYIHQNYGRGFYRNYSILFYVYLRIPDNVDNCDPDFRTQNI